MSNKNVKSIEILEASLYSVYDKKYDMTKVVTAFMYFESINDPFVSAVANVVDSGMNLIGTLPIQGGERFYIKIKDVEGSEYEYDMHIWKVYNRSFTKNMQVYNLALTSREALYNEGARITEILKGTPDTIVTKILTEYLKTEKKINTETPKYQVQFYPSGRKAHSIIQALSQKAVPQSSGKSKSDTGKETTGGKTGLSGDTKTSSGTAGYLFFENSDGFNFKSIDFYYSTGDDKFRGDAEVDEYTVKPNNDDPDRKIIEDYRFTNEIDLIEQMRNGSFASQLVVYNFSTGFYEEFRYNLSDNYKEMSHLGSQDKLGKSQTELSTNPSRVMTVLLDHETWNMKETTGSPEERDGEGQGSEYPDYQKYWLAQSIARRYFMENQKLEIEVPGNMKLKVGDKIKVLLPNTSGETGRKDFPYDEENSGTYMISALSHNNVFLNSSTCTTKLELIRDAYGMKDLSSNVK